MHSSQNEQDNRHYARAAKVPMLEPSDSEEARRFTRLAFELSERFDTPVILRSTTRISHSQSVVFPEEKPKALPPAKGFVRNLKKYVMIPAHARERHKVVEQHIKELAAYCETLDINRMEMADTSFGVITSGISYMYVREKFPSVSLLKLGIVWPLPSRMLKEFTSRVTSVYIVEELDPFLETEIKAMGINVQGKEFFPVTGEFSPDVVESSLQKAVQGKSDANGKRLASAFTLPPRPPSLCPGCPHRTVFKILGELGVTVSGDIGCYTLGVLPPFQAMDTCVEMGGSIGLAQGIEIAEGEKGIGKTVAIIGDSTFAHSGITGLINAAYNKRRSLFIVLDNNTTAMTGMQPNPLSGQRINFEETVAIDYCKLGEAAGLKADDVVIVNAFRPKEVEAAIKRLLGNGRLSLLVVKGACILWKKKSRKK
jgi:indolepyruvate ferredoxin oxidoreductase alpha subunit